MAAFYDETRARYEQLSVDDFMQTVLQGALQEHLQMADTLINVYSQILHTIPEAAALRLGHLPSGTPDALAAIPTLFDYLAHEIHETFLKAVDDTATLVLTVVLDQQILEMTAALRGRVEEIDRWAAALEADANLCRALPRLNNRCVVEMAGDIRQRLFDVQQVLSFAQVYALRSRLQPLS